MRGDIDTDAATAVWDAALAAPWSGPRVWVHGDVSSTNLLASAGRSSAVIDFGCAAVGDPACDLAIAWTLFTGASRAAFRASIALDEDAWARGRGWALWKGLITIVEHRHTDQARADEARRVVAEVLADHRGTT